MQNFEEVYKEMEKLFIEKLPTYIEKINEKKNDGLIIQPFNNTSLEENCIKQPCFGIVFNGGVHSVKDRIIETDKFNVKIEIKLPGSQKKLAVFWRYVEAINLMIDEEETFFDYEILQWNETTIDVQVWGG
ncbi:MAG: hypothetical protein SOT46_05345 [Treponema sp.]|nr:hypothetical protein [Treponema sp.]MDY2839781.1 hypothetical protein [Treponema sp.]